MNYMPVQGSIFAGQWDAVWDFVLWASIIASILVIGGMCYFVVKYQRRTNSDKTAYITHNKFLEFLWSFIPLVIFMIIAYWGMIVYDHMREFPKDAFEISITGQKWVWNMSYPNGLTLTNELVVPAGRPIVLNMTSKDVIHSFYIPSFRIKQDVVPGHRSKLWFQSDKIGEYHLFCAEYCGTNHSGMLGKVRVVDGKDFDDLMQKSPTEGQTPVDLGKALYSQKACIGCHSLDGSRLVGPSWKGLFNHTVEFEGGGSGTADENYIRESILNPNAKIVKGFPPNQMPVYQGQLKEEEITAIIEFIKSLK